MVVGESSQPPVKDTTLTFQCPILTSTNYTIWRMRMEFLLGIHRVWDVVDPGSDDAKKNNIVKGLLFQSIPEDLEARLQTLITEFENMKMLDNGTIDEYAAKLSGPNIPTGIMTQVEEEDMDHALEVVDEVEYGHFVSKLPERNRNHEVNLNETQENGEYHEEGTFFMMNHIQETIFMNEEKYTPSKSESNTNDDDYVWYFDNGASNHMTAKFMAATTAACQAIWLKELLTETGLERQKMIIRVDNKSAIALSKNPVFHGRSKHIHTRYHFIRECVENEQVIVEHVSGENQRVNEGLGAHKVQGDEIVTWCARATLFDSEIQRVIIGEFLSSGCGWKACYQKSGNPSSSASPTRPILFSI
ncbi:uncharacterized mitochondrial protein-like protein [Tanacetum coccineum]